MMSRSAIRRRRHFLLTALTVAVLVSGCATTKEPEKVPLMTKEEMKVSLTSTAREVLLTTGIQLTSAGITWSSCAENNDGPPSRAFLSGMFPLKDTPAEAEAEIDAWGSKLTSAGWIQTPPDSLPAVEVKQRIFSREGVVLFLTPFAKSDANPMTVFMLRTECLVDSNGLFFPEDGTGDVLPLVNGK